MEEKAARIAEERLGMSSLQMHGAHEAAKYMPKGMQDIGSEMHRSAIRFAIEAQNAGVTVMFRRRSKRCRTSRHSVSAATQATGSGRSASNPRCVTDWIDPAQDFPAFVVPRTLDAPLSPKAYPAARQRDEPMHSRPQSRPVVELRGIAKHFGEGQTRVDALRDITLSVSSGEVVGLIGPSGSGKSTLLNVIGAIIDPNAGWMRLDGEIVYDNRWLRSDLRRMRLEKIGFIFQTHNLLPFLDATDNVALVFQLAGVPRGEAIERSVNLLEYLQVGHRKHAMPAQLSGGEAQRVAIARALANKPRIILADEPTAPLDSARAAIVMDLLRKLAREQEAAIITVTHDEKIYDHLDRIYKLRDGQLIEAEERAAA